MQLKRQIYKEKKSKTPFVYLIVWFISIVLAVIWTYENPDKIELIKNIYKKNQDPVSKEIKAQSIKILANSFIVNYENIISLSHKTSFVLYDKEEELFNPNLLKI